MRVKFALKFLLFELLGIWLFLLNQPLNAVGKCFVLTLLA